MEANTTTQTADNQAPAQEASALEQNLPAAAPAPAQQLPNPYAVARRQAEAEKAHEIAAITARVDTYAQAHGFATFAEMEKAGQSDALPEGAMTPGMITSVVQQALGTQLEQHPLLQMAREQMQQNIVNQDLDDFKRAFPNAGVNAVGDLLKVPNFGEFKRLVDLGLTYVQAYKLANEGALQAQSVAAAKQAARNQINGKEHMAGTEAAGDDPDGDVAVPEETMRGYRVTMPGWSDAQIKKHYKKSHS